MLKKTSSNTLSKPYLHVASKQTDTLTIKVFDIYGKKAKTISKVSDYSMNDVNSEMIDLQKGQYVLNAFKNGVFVKSFRFIKD